MATKQHQEVFCAKGHWASALCICFASCHALYARRDTNKQPWNIKALPKAALVQEMLKVNMNHLIQAMQKNYQIWQKHV